MSSKSTSIVEALRSLFSDQGEYERYSEDPGEWVRDHGLESASYEDINEAVVIAFDGPINQGAVVNGGSASVSVGSTSAAGAGAAAGAVAPVMAGPAAAAAAPAAVALTLPPPPPEPAADMEPADAVSQVINHYVTHVYETTEVDDRDTFTDNSVVNNVNAEHGAQVDITNDNDTVTASGDGAVAGGEDSDFEGVATGDGAVAAGDDIDGNVNTGSNTGVIGDDADIDDSIFGDGNTQVNDNDGPAVVGDENVVAGEDGQAAGGNIVDTDIDIEDSDLNGSNVGGVGNTAVQDNDDLTQDNDVTTTILDVDTSIDASIEGSFHETDVEVDDHSVEDSFNPEDSFNTEATFEPTFEPEPLHFESVDLPVLEAEPMIEEA